MSGPRGDKSAAPQRPAPAAAPAAAAAGSGAAEGGTAAEEGAARREQGGGGGRPSRGGGRGEDPDDRADEGGAAGGGPAEEGGRDGEGDGEGGGGGGGSDGSEPEPRRRRQQHQQQPAPAAGPRNELTHLVPGYTAPMAFRSSLPPSSPKGGRPGPGAPEPQGAAEDGLEAIRRRALLEDHPVRARRAEPGGGSFSSGGGWTSHPQRAVGHASREWFQRNATPLTDDVRKDLQLIRNRNYLDPKRFYKKANDPSGQHVQVGTVVEGAAEYYSSRLAKRERRSNLVDEVLADPASSDYARGKFKKMQQERTVAAHKRKRHQGWGRRGPQKRR